jgi:hypothetical protein
MPIPCNGVEYCYKQSTVSYPQRMDAIGTAASWNVKEEALRALMTDAERAMQIYGQAGNPQGELRAKLLLADLLLI